MQNKHQTLHLIAAAPRHWSTLMPQIQSVWQNGDLLLLIGEGAQGYDAKILQQFGKVTAFQPDLVSLGVDLQALPDHVITANAIEWAAWTMQHLRTITWR